jgi:hypothetical protein
MRGLFIQKTAVRSYHREKALAPWFRVLVVSGAVG